MNPIKFYTKDQLDADMQWIYDSRNMSFDKTLNIEHYCDVPFTTVNVDKTGRVFICGCQHWLPLSVGNILDFNSFEEIFESPVAKDIQRTILDHSYKYCDVGSCDLNDRLREYPELSHYKGNNLPPSLPLRLVINIDDSCNLTCPSCRTKFIFDKEGETFDFKMRVSDHLASFVSKFEGHIQFELAGDGDPFASTVYRNFLTKIKFKNPNSYVIINSNGLLLKDHWAALHDVEDQINTIKVSLDAGTESVYNVTRRLGQWDKIVGNLKWLVQYKKEHNSKFIIATNFVVQKANVQDIRTYAKLVSAIGVDVIYFQKVNDWGTWVDFDNIAVWKETHVDYERMCRSLELVKDMPKVQLTNLLDYAKTE